MVRGPRRLSLVANCGTAQLKAVIDNLYFLIAQSHDHHGTQTTQAMTEEMYHSCLTTSPSDPRANSDLARP